MQNNDQILEAIEHYLGQIGYPEEPGRLYAPISYSLTMTGKRLRPMLLMLTCGIFSDQPQAAMPAAAAVEVFHNFTLLHDDIMDNAAMRRGNPSVFAKWGQNVAILSGDAMLISAYRLLSEYPPQVLPQILARFNTMAIEVCEGQQYDMDFEARESVSVEEYLHMIELKTSALLSGATVIGAIIGGAGEEDCQRLYRFATELGLAFQLQDDWLDVYGDPARFGKKIGGDILNNKKTYMLINARQRVEGKDAEELSRWLSAAEYDPSEKIAAVTALYDRVGAGDLCLRQVDEYSRRAIEALRQIGVDEAAKQPLYDLANSLIKRDH